MLNTHTFTGRVNLISNDPIVVEATKQCLTEFRIRVHEKLGPTGSVVVGNILETTEGVSNGFYIKFNCVVFYLN